MVDQTAIKTALFPSLARLVADETGALELEIRFGELHRGGKEYFQTGVRPSWMEAVRVYLHQSGWVDLRETAYQQYKVGQNRVRVFADGKVECIAKRVISQKNVILPKAKDIRISLAKESKMPTPTLTGKHFDEVVRQTLMWDAFRFDLTKIRHCPETRWEYRVELEIVNAIHQAYKADAMQSDLIGLVGKVAAIAER